MVVLDVAMNRCSFFHIEPLVCTYLQRCERATDSPVGCILGEIQMSSKQTPVAKDALISAVCCAHLACSHDRELCLLTCVWKTKLSVWSRSTRWLMSVMQPLPPMNFSWPPVWVPLPPPDFNFWPGLCPWSKMVQKTSSNLMLRGPMEPAEAKIT